MNTPVPASEPTASGEPAPSACAPPPRATPATTTATDLALVGLAAVAMRIPALAATHHLSFDDGVYGASAVAMRDGGRPFQDVFSSQGPLFLPLVRLADLAGGEGLRSPRLAAVAAGAVVTIAVYLAGRELTDRRGALLAAGLAATTGSLVAVTGPIHADGPALAAATTAFWLALRQRREPSTASALALGLATGAAVSLKATAVVVAVPVGWVLLAPILGSGAAWRSVRAPALARLGLATLAAACVWALPTAVLGPAEVWEQSVAYHLGAGGGRDPLANATKVASTASDRDLVLVVAALGALVHCGWLRRAGGGNSPAESEATARRRSWLSPSALTLTWSWLLATMALLLVVHPLWRPHVSGLVAPAALLVGAHRPTGRALALLVVVLAPMSLWRSAPFLIPGDADAPTLALRAELDLLPPTAWVISDEPGLVWMAGRRTPDDLVDTSRLRIEAGHLTPATVAGAATDPQVCAVVAWSQERFGAWPDLRIRLSEVGYLERARFGNGRTLYQREDCQAA